MKLVPCVLALMLATPLGAMAETVDASCGGSSFQVDITRHEHPLDTKYQLYGTPAGGGAKKRLLTWDGGGFDAGCVADAQGHQLVMVQVNCGGSVCTDEFGLVDPRNLRWLLKPSGKNRRNDKAAAAILKLPPKRMPYLESGKPPAFCCEVPVAR